MLLNLQASFFTEIREVVRAEDLSRFDQLIYGDGRFRLSRVVADDGDAERRVDELINTAEESASDGLDDLIRRNDYQQQQQKQWRKTANNVIDFDRYLGDEPRETSCRKTTAYQVHQHRHHQQQQQQHQQQLSHMYQNQFDFDDDFSTFNHQLGEQETYLENVDLRNGHVDSQELLMLHRLRQQQHHHQQQQQRKQQQHLHLHHQQQPHPPKVEL